MKIVAKPFGTSSFGEVVTCFTIRCGSAVAELLDYGCILRSLTVPDRSGTPTDVVLGYDDLDGYERNAGNYFGAVVGRHANRIGKGSFALGGHSYTLACNNGPNHLHGGLRGFDRYVWAHRLLSDNSICFSRLSPDGEEGYPGNLQLSVTYTLLETDGVALLRIDYDAQTDADTVVNLTNHSYFNLNGGGGTILDHQLLVHAASYTENDSDCLPTGVVAPVAGTPFDFRAFKPIGLDIAADHPQVAMFGGYDHNFCLDDTHGHPVAELWSQDSGIKLTTTTTKPGVQVYSSCAMGPNVGKGGCQYDRYSGVCLETQFWPNALACAQFPSPVLPADGRYCHTTTYGLSVVD